MKIIHEMTYNVLSRMLNFGICILSVY